MNLWSTKSLIIFFHFTIMAKCDTIVSMMEEDQAFNSILGKSIYVPQEDLVGSIPNAITLFKDIPDNCLRKIDLAITTKDQSYYKNTAEFYKSIATETNLEASYEGEFTLGVTLDVTTKQVSGNKRDVSGTSLNLATKSYEHQLSPNCLYEISLQPRMLSDFSKLKTKVSSPWYQNSWRDYQTFLETHGSHVVTGVTYGSSIDQYAFAEQSSSYTAKDFTVKACASLGVQAGVGSVGLSACSGVTKEDKESVSNKKMSTTITVKGGTANTRNKIIYQRTDELIIKFLNEGNTNPTPIEFELTPIWKIMRGQSNAVSGNSDTRVRALNLQYYFDGYLNFGCPYRKGERGPQLQKFDLAARSIPDNPVYECTLAPQGCHSDWDCHYHLGVWCNCAGKSCIRHDQTKSSAGVTKTTADPYYANDWGWNGCNWRVVGSVCACTMEDTSRVEIWPMS